MIGRGARAWARTKFHIHFYNSSRVGEGGGGAPHTPGGPGNYKSHIHNIHQEETAAKKKTRGP
jgi:hypothetical protein